MTVAVKVTFCPKAEGLSDDVTPVVVSALLTVCPPLSEPLLLLKLVFPLLRADRRREPTLSDVVLAWAVPPLMVAAALRIVPSTMNRTVPAGVPAPGGLTVTVAVKVTFCPKLEGLTEDETLVAVPALLTT